MPRAREACSAAARSAAARCSDCRAPRRVPEVTGMKSSRASCERSVASSASRLRIATTRNPVRTSAPCARRRSRAKRWHTTRAATQSARLRGSRAAATLRGGARVRAVRQVRPRVPRRTAGGSTHTEGPTTSGAKESACNRARAQAWRTRSPRRPGVAARVLGSAFCVHAARQQPRRWATASAAEDSPRQFPASGAL